MSGSTKQNRFRILCAVLFCAVLLLVSAAAASTTASITISGVYNGVPPVPDFTYTPPNPITGDSVTFTGTSTGSPVTWYWTFGDSTIGTGQIASHSYSSVGTYTVTLTVTNVAGLTGTKSKPITVSVPPLKADFTAIQTTCKCSWKVIFNDISTGTYTTRAWAWQKVGTSGWTTFGNGAQSSFLSFSTSAPYNIRLIVTNAAGNSNTLIKTITPGNLKAAFSASPTSGPSPLTVTFTDTSVGVPTSWKWEVMKGSGSYSQVSTDQNPSLIFNTPGTYYVQLTAKSSCGSKTSSPMTITVTPWYDCGWQYRKTITIDKSKVGATLANFPVLINLASDNELKNGAQSSGNDILFTSSDGTTQLPHEIESYTSSTGALIAWVKVPSVSSTANTIIYMYYNKPDASDQQNRNGVWDSNYVGVWHLSESGSGTANEFKDSTSNANHGRGGDGTSTRVPMRTTSGRIGPAQDFNRANTQFINIPDATSLRITGPLTLEAWVKGDSWVTGDNGVVTRQYGTSTGNSYGLKVNANTGYGWFTGGKVSGGTVKTASWYHLVVNHIPTASYIFVNGVQVGSAKSLSISTDMQPVIIGGGETGATTTPTQLFDGMIDEVRISNTARSTIWIKTEYNNQNSPSTFYSLGNKEQHTC